MALTKHMTGGDMLRIRRLMAAGVTKVEDIQKEVRVHPSRIKQVIDVGIKKPKKQTAADKAKAKAASKAAVDPVS